jgi:hypothetical protein
MFPHNRVHEVEQLAQKVTIPLFDDSTDQLRLLGTGTLFEIEDRKFIVTARHIFFDDSTNEDVTARIHVSYPKNPIRSDIVSLGQFDRYADVSNEALDVALVELKDSEVIRSLSVHWRFMGLEDICMPSADGVFFVAGFPVTNTSWNKGWVHGKLTTIYSRLLSVVPDDAKRPVDTTVDLLFAYDREAEARDGRRTPTPPLEGMSGAAVWQYFPTKRIWTLKPQIALVGVQSAYHPAQYFRAKNWRAVAAIASSIDSKLGERINAKLKV